MPKPSHHFPAAARLAAALAPDPALAACGDDDRHLRADVTASSGGVFSDDLTSTTAAPRPWSRRWSA